MPVVHVNGLDVGYDRAGEGPPLVLLHGAGGDAREWGPQLDGLGDALSVVAWDEPGAGRSSDLPAGFTLADYADCAIGLVETLGLAPAFVGGISWGGTLALEVYRRRPGLVAGLVLVDTYAGWKGSLPAEEVAARLAGANAMLDEASEDVDPVLPGLFGGSPPAEAVALVEAMAADVRVASMRTALGLMAEADLTDLLPRIEVPTLLVWGEEDARSPIRIAHELAAAIPGARLVVIPGAGHLSNLERPDAVNDAIRAFVEARPPAGPAEVIAGVFAAFSDRDAERMVALCHPDVEFWPEGTADATGAVEPYRGHAGIAAYFADVERTWERLELVPDELRTAGGGVVAFGRASGVLRGGTVVEVPVIWTFKLRDGLLLSGRAVAGAAAERPA